MTSFEGAVIVLLLIIAVGIVWIGMRQDSKLYLIHDRIGIMLGFINRIGRSDPKISEIEKNTYGIFNIVEQMHKNTCAIIAGEAVNKMFPVEKGEPLDKPFEPMTREELVKKYGDILAGHVSIYTNPHALDALGTYINAMADFGWLDIINRHEPKGCAEKALL